MRHEREVCEILDPNETLEPMAQGDSMPSGEGEVRDMVEEGVKSVVRRTERKPSAKEVEEHMMTHLPFRSRYSMCVQGKSKTDPHRAREDRDSEALIVSIDYMYMEGSEEEYKVGMPILVVKDRDSRWIAARGIPKRGRDAHAVRELGRVMDFRGY